MSRDLVPVIDAIASGDHGALALLYRRTSAKLYGICAHLLGNSGEAEDVLQDVYVTVWQKAAQFDADKASPITWLAILARNKAIDRLRRNRLPTTGLDAAENVADTGASAFELVERDGENVRLSRCLDELEAKHRDMIRSAFMDGKTYPELAKGAAVPLGTMKSWIRRSLIKLRGCLER